MPDTSRSRKAPEPTSEPASAAPAGTAAATIATITDPCAVAGPPRAALAVLGPELTDPTRVRVAHSLMSTYLYGMRLGFFAAVDRARELLDTQDLCLGADDDDLRNELYCWPHRYDRVSPQQRATLMARVLGRPDPAVPGELVDTRIEPLLTNLLDLVNSVCDPGPFRTDPTPATLDTLGLARESVRYRLSQTVTELVALQANDLAGQLERADAVLSRLATTLATPCQRGFVRDTWASLDRLVGPQLRADQVDVVSVAGAAQAWDAVFSWLADDIPADDLRDSVVELCGAVSRLRPPRARSGCGCGSPALPAVS